MNIGPRKIDFFVAAIAGFFTALFVLPVVKNTGISVPGYLLPVLVPVLWIIGLALGRILLRRLSFIYQFAKFVVVGFLNTSIDFGILNLLSIYTGITSGFFIGGVNVPGFILASMNSYFWNKFWVFRKEKKEGEKTNYSDFLTFAGVTLVAVLLNGGIVILITTFVNPLFGLSPERWLNIAKVFATAFSLIFNFVGYKFLVFRSKPKELPQVSD